LFVGCLFFDVLFFYFGFFFFFFLAKGVNLKLHVHGYQRQLIDTEMNKR